MILFDRCSLLQQNVRLCLFVRRIGRGDKEYCSDSGSGAEESESVCVCKPLKMQDRLRKL